MNKDFSDIIEGCCRKNRDSQRKLYEYFSACMYAVCLRYTNSEADAQDVLHEGFMKVFDKIGQFKSDGSFEGWIRRIMVNTALEKFRKKKNTEDLYENQNHINMSSSSDVNSDLTAQELLILINELTPQYKMVFNLYAIEGYSHKEIGKMLHISEGTSKSNLSRARTILQERIRENEQHMIKKVSQA